MRRLGCLLVAFLLQITLLRKKGQVDAFNIDTRMPEVIQGQEGSWFGYSVALWSDKKGQKSVVVGAPRGTLADSANETYPLGNIYICQPKNTGDEDQCSVRLDLPLLNEDDFSLQAVHLAKDIIIKQGIGFGETLYTASRPSTSLLACAPRYPRYNILGDEANTTQLQTRGVCYMLNEQSPSATALKVLPYPDVDVVFGQNQKQSFNDHGSTGFAEAGFSALLNEAETNIYLGGSYAFNGQGMVIRAIASDGKRRSVTRDQLDEDKTMFGNMEGWALVSGKFDGRRELIATSLPDGNVCKGSVMFYMPNLKKAVAERSGKELGSKFGFSLAAGDFNGDKIDDLAVGAPLSAVRGRLQDVGKVFVYYAPAKQDNLVTPTEPLELEGREPWGRFGQAITCPGDLDLDGYDDLVVGAPGTVEGRGTVYIFNGGKEGLRQQPSQVIFASKFPFSLSWFGFSLDGGLDLDENGYPDITIGAPDTDKAIILRSGPVVLLQGSLDFESPEISLGSLSCQVLLQNGQRQNVDCFNLVINLQYTAKHIDHPLAFRFEIKVDSYRQRVAFLDSHDYRYSLIYNVTHNDTEPMPLVLKLYVKPNVRRLNINDPLEANLTTALVDSDGSRYPQSNNFSEKRNSPHSAEAFSVISAYSETSFFSRTRFSCDDVTCVSQCDLLLTAEKPDHVLVGKGSAEVKVNLEVRNNTAHSLVLEMQAPNILTLLRAQSDDYLPECVPKRDDGEDIVFICRFISEIPKDVKIKLSFAFKYDPLPLMEHQETHLRFKFNASSDTPDLQPLDNSLEVLVPKVSKVDLRAEGMPDPDTMEGRLNKSLLWQVVGQRLVHRFELTNHGPSPLLQSKIILGIPRHHLDGFPSLNLMDLKTSSNVKCVLPTFNPLNLTIEEEEADGNSTTDLGEDEDTAYETDEENDTLDYLRGGNYSLTDDTSADYDFHDEVTSRRKKRRILYNPGEIEDITTSSTFESSSEDPTTPLPRLLNSSTPDTVKDRPSEDSGKMETLTINCSNTECQEIECEVSTLLVDEYASVEIISYLVAGSFRLRYLKSLVIETGMTVLTSQDNVFLNGRVVLEEALNFSEDTLHTGNHTTDADGNIPSNFTEGMDPSLVGLDPNKTSVTDGSFDNVSSWNENQTTSTEGHTGSNGDTEDKQTTMSNYETITEADLEDKQTTRSARMIDLRSDSEENGTALSYDDETSPGVSHSAGTSLDVDISNKPVTKATDITQSSSAVTTKDADVNNTQATRETTSNSASTEEYAEHGNFESESNTLKAVTDIDKELLVENSSSDSSDDISTTKDISSTLIATDVPFSIHEISNMSLFSSADLTLQSQPSLIKAQGSRDTSATVKDSGDLEDKDTVTDINLMKKYPIIASTYVMLIREHEERKINVESLLEIGMWKLILAVCGGLMLIIILCAILYKLGFFKRKRISEEEREQLQQKLKESAEKEKYF